MEATKLNWNALTPQGFADVGEMIAKRTSEAVALKKQAKKKRAKISKECVRVKIRGKEYNIPATMAERIQSLTKEKRESELDLIVETIPCIEKMEFN